MRKPVKRVLKGWIARDVGGISWFSKRPEIHPTEKLYVPTKKGMNDYLELWNTIGALGMRKGQCRPVKMTITVEFLEEK